MSTTESDVSIIFDEARTKLEQIDSQAYGAKKRVIKELAEKLEGAKLKVDTIADEIVHNLEGRVGKSLIYNTLDEKYKQKTKPKKKIPHVESAIDEQMSVPKREVLVGSDGSSHSAEDEPSRIERLPDQGDFTARSLAVAAEEKSKDERIAQLESDIASKDYELHQLRALLKNFHADGKIIHNNQILPYTAEIDPQARRILSSEMNVIEARRVNQ